MTGNYPSIPFPRMAYDRDGTQLFSNSVQQSQAVMAGTNSENSNGGINVIGNFASVSLLWVFPELRDLKAWYLAGRGGGSFSSFQYSTNTTNGIDGTWTNIGTGAPAAGQAGTAVEERTNITVLGSPITGIRAIRLTWSKTSSNSGGNLTAHFYGGPSTGQNPNRLEFWHPTLDQSINSSNPDWLDFGDRPRATVATKQFRLKNLSSALTANSITLAVEALTDTSPAVVGMHDLSLDGVSFSSSVVLSTLAPGVISAPITLRQSLSSSAILSIWTQRLYAAAGAWV